MPGDAVHGVLALCWGKLPSCLILLSSAITTLPIFFLITLAPRDLLFEYLLARFFLFISTKGENLWSPML
ncbi:hypothetical protein BA188_22795 [Aeromonas hydrophila]|nr:hypothetical protein OI72_15130 [Aeromonas hydrophila]OFC44801.1 hypothetical protein BA189_18190 [Aeromonas hydrophila]OFC54296.1 hypothetical protein BA188_22795 [Aeromonas hydrophila]